VSDLVTDMGKRGTVWDAVYFLIFFKTLLFLKTYPFSEVLPPPSKHNEESKTNRRKTLQSDRSHLAEFRRLTVLVFEKRYIPGSYHVILCIRLCAVVHVTFARRVDDLGWSWQMAKRVFKNWPKRPQNDLIEFQLKNFSLEHGHIMVEGTGYWLWS